MKNLLSILFFIAFTQQIFSQGCTVTATAPKDTIVCGDRISLSAFGQGQGVAVLTESFNGGTYGPGWQSTQQATWNNPCSPSGVDGTTHIWMGSSSPVPRILTTAPFNFLSCATAGVTICFDMLFATQGNTAPCEGPDEPQEGVYLQYSINGTVWTDIHYFDPNGGSDPQLINWNNWCFPVPAAAITSTTRFRFFQDADSGADFDHWGVDNVAIYCNDPTFNIVWQHDGYSSGPIGGVNPTPVAPNVTTNYIITMSNGTVTCSDTITIVVKNPNVLVNAGTDTTICAGQCARLNGTAKVIVSPAKTPTYSNNELTQITTGFGAVSDIGINITDLNMTNVLPNSITQVCINNVFFFGANIFPPSQIDISDLILTLTCPSGQVITLVPANVTTGGSNPLTGGYNNTCFVPSGGANIASGTPPYSGSFAPSQPFSNLNGCNANGVWTLGVQMNSAIGFGTGTFSGWNISFIDPEIAYTGNYNWTPTTNMTNSTTLQPTVCPTANSTYTLTASDTAGCVTRTDAVNVNVQAVCCNLSATATTTQPTCGASNGAIDLTPVPAGTYTYIWSDGAITTQDRTGLAAGIYSVTITNSANPTCSFDTSIILNSNSSLTATITKVDPTCAGGGTNGSATLIITGGTAPFTITIDTGGTPFTITVPFNPGPQTIGSQDAGTVTVSITDAASCTATATTTLIAPFCCSLTATTTTTQPTCGASNGAINVTPQPAATYTYAWSDGAITTQNRTGLAAGTYTVTITTASNTTCTFTTTVVLNQSSAITITQTVVNPTCAGNNGSVSTVISGGNGSYSYAWSNSTSTSSVSNLTAGSISLTVTDGTCSATETYQLVAPAAITVTVADQTVVTCTTGTTGTLIAIVTGGTPAFTFVWSGSSQTDSILDFISGGTYTVTVTDASGCTASDAGTLTIQNGTPIIFSNPVITDVTCTNLGSITASATGSGTLTYAWSNQQTGATINNLQPGNYTVSVTSPTSCSAVATYTVDAAAGAVFISSTAVVNTICNGDSTGSISVLANGGTGTLTYAWSNGETTNINSTLSAATYTVTVSDPTNCSTSATYVVTQPIAINPNLNFSSIICFNSTTGSASVAPTGGTPTYTYIWSTGATSASILNQPVGIIQVTVTDNNSCSVKASGIIAQAEQLWYTSILNINLCEGAAYGNLDIQATGGLGTITYNVPSVGSNNTGDFSTILSGSYTFSLTDSLGCIATGNFVVPASIAADNFAINTDSAACFGSADGEITVTLVSGNPTYQYSLNGGAFQTDSIFTGLAAGNYTVVTKSSYGCLDTLNATIGQPIETIVAANPDTIFTAPGADNAITVTVQNYSNPVYNWLPVTGLSCVNCSNPTANVQASTVFYVNVTEGQNLSCVALDSVVVIVSGGSAMPNAFTPNGDGKNDVFGPVTKGSATIKQFRIYNRWGALMHNQLESWNGKFEGKDQVASTYIYYIELESPAIGGGVKTEKLQGSFTLIR